MKWFSFKVDQLSPDEKKGRKKKMFFCIATGLMLGLSFPPLPFPFLMFVAFIPYFFVIENSEKLIVINRYTYLTFFITNLITIYWVGSWQESADPFLMIAGGLLLFVNPVFFLIPSTLIYYSRRIFKKNSLLFLFPLFWITYEYLYMITDASFPWLTLGSGLSYLLSFIQIAEFIGAVGISLLVLYINIFIYKGLTQFQPGKNKGTLYLITASIMIILPMIYGNFAISTYKQPEKSLRVGIIQPNLNPWDKWETGDIMDLTQLYFNYSEQAIKQGAELIVWPETALPVYLIGGSYHNIVDSIHSFIREKNVYLLTGMPDFRIYKNKEDAPDDAKYSEVGDYYFTTYNGILLFSPNTFNVQRYGKMKLVPFGERTPFVDQLPFLADAIRWSVGLSGWNVGKDTINMKMSFDTEERDTINISGLVCYESIYPYLVNEFVLRGADFITVVTNDSWYGYSSGPFQHKEIAVLRAIENRRAVIRCANGGISCIIDPLGRTLDEKVLFTQAVLVGDVPIESKQTFFTRHSLIIPVLASAFSFFVAGTFFLLKLKTWMKI